MYQRILSKIPRGSWELARTALLWICGIEAAKMNRRVPVVILLQAMHGTDMTMTEPPEQDAQYVALTSNHIRDVCGCLVTITDGPFPDDDPECVHIETAALAHYSVREYLTSDHIRASSVSYFAITDEVIREEFLPSVARRGAAATASTGHSLFNLDTYCARLAHYGFREEISARDDICRHLLRSLNPNGVRAFHKRLMFPGEFTLMSYPDWWDGPDNRIEHQAKILSTLLQRYRFLIPTFLSDSETEPLNVLLEAQLTFKGDSRAPGRRSEISGQLIGSIIQIYCEDYLSYVEGLLWDSDYSRNLDRHRLLLAVLSVHFHECLCGSGCMLDRFIREGHSNNGVWKMTPLQIAVQNWDMEGVRRLLEDGADPNAVGSAGGSAGYGMGAVSTRWASFSPLHILRHAEFGLSDWSLGIWKRRVSRRRYCRSALETLLLRHGARDWYLGEDGSECEGPSGFEIAALQVDYRAQLHAASRDGNVEEVKRLLESGADPDAALNTGSTALVEASLNGNCEVAKVLLENDANVDLGNHAGWTPLHASASNGHVDVVKLLLEYHPATGRENNVGQTPLDTAEKNHHTDVAELLRGVDE